MSNPPPPSRWPSSQAVIEQIRSQTDTVMLAFSTGKDSLACLTILKNAGFNIVPYHAFYVPGLKFVERSLDYYEEFFDLHIYRTIDPNFYRWLKTYGFQPPARMATLDWLHLPAFKHQDIQQGIARTVGLDEESYWCAVGTRMSDSLNRRLMFKNHGPVDSVQRKFYPVYDLNKSDLIPILQEAKVKLSVDYKIFGRSFCGLDYRFLKAIREHYPEDYDTIKFWFPLIDLEFAKYELGEAHATKEKNSAA